MKIDKEKEVETKIHKKKNGKIYKMKEVKIDNKVKSTRTKNNAGAMRKVVESIQTTLKMVKILGEK